MKIKTSFSPENTFFNGQCFRWNQEGDSFVGVVEDKVLRLRKEGDYLYVEGIREDELDWLLNYLGFEDDLEEKEEAISKIDPFMAAAVEHGRGLHMLRQEPFETLISFIISANNHIPRIKSLVERLAENYGDELEPGYYAFPRPEQLAEAKVEDLRALGLGYRDKYIHHAANLIASGQVDLESLYELDSFSAGKELEKAKGVGKKVASCVLLFAFGKRDAFPVDTWIKKALAEHYSEEIENYSSIEEFLAYYFGPDGGLAQQYLFHYMRTGTKTKSS